MPKVKRISIIQGHPDPDEGRFCRALARAYAGGAESAGHSIRWVNVATLKFPMAANTERVRERHSADGHRGGPTGD